MVRDTNHTTNIIIVVESTGSIGYHHHLDGQTPHDIDGQNGSLHVVAFIGMKPSSPANGRDATELPKYHFTLVSWNGTMRRKSRNVRIGNTKCLAFERFRESRETRSANDTQSRKWHICFFQAFLEVGGGLPVGFERFVHHGRARIEQGYFILKANIFQK